MSTHTPGPWGVERDGFSIYMSNQVVATAIAPDGASIHEQRANASLIAAAPDLLAALEQIAVARTVNDRISIARAALAKAKA